MQTRVDLLPQIEAEYLPVVGHVVEVAFDDGGGRKTGVVERVRHVVAAGLAAGVQQRVGELGQYRGADGRPVRLRAAPAPPVLSVNRQLAVIRSSQRPAIATVERGRGPTNVKGWPST